jgi:hypothetical protein
MHECQRSIVYRLPFLNHNFLLQSCWLTDDLGGLFVASGLRWEKRAIRGRKARVWGIVGMGMNLNLCRMNFLFLWMLKINGLGFVK